MTIKKMTSFLLSVILFSALSFVPQKSQAEPMKDFLMSCVYGTLSGALVGAATLAFSEDPTSSMNNIARGASLGLYAGIGLGLYLNMSGSEQLTQIIPLKNNSGHIDGAIVQLNTWQF
jgi:hypothetical protein